MRSVFLFSLRSFAVKGQKSVLFLGASGYAKLPDLEAIAGRLAEYDFAAVIDPQAARVVVANRTPRVDILVTNIIEESVFDDLYTYSPEAKVILYTNEPTEKIALWMDKYPGRLDVVSQRNESSVRELEFALRAILSHSGFAIENFSSFEWRHIVVESTRPREAHNDAVSRFAESCKLNSATMRSLWNISEELLMNAVFDAPRAAAIERFKNTDNSALIPLDPNERPTLSYGFDGQWFVVRVRDPFGKFDRSNFGKYIKKLAYRENSAAIVDQHKAGAGLGLMRVLYGSHGLICNVTPNKLTDCIVFIDTKDTVKDFAKSSRSFHYHLLTQ